MPHFLCSVPHLCLCTNTQKCNRSRCDFSQFLLSSTSLGKHESTLLYLTQLEFSALRRPAKMPENAEAVSATLTTNRNCTIELTNVTTGYCLINPKVYMYSGYCYHPPQPTVRTPKTEVCSFIMDDDTATGAVGVLTYDLFHIQSRVCSERMAIMFSVPYDYNYYKNWLGVGVFEVARACDKQLYNHMYKEKDFSKFVRSEASGSGLEYKAQHVDLRATMSTVGKSIIKVELYDKMGH
ncbi:bryoporin isoform X1 [Salmo salar]|uniref:Bryoporin isoform X1 n=2 Tax=Salmo salar TaxID=8030 RepID=A0A1S3S5K1_SALSA|nr:bryoporin-like isoform X1 [Salmo salar]|eukprot:XP_014059621.1 PREDICTED: uncharacterized protein LOC106607309 isoform X1 [Salmo salar]